MATYGDMQARIADEMLSAATTAQIQNAIQDAIRKYERQRFWFNAVLLRSEPLENSSGIPITDSSGAFIDSQPAFSTIQGLEFYDKYLAPAMGTLAHIDKLVLVQGSTNRYSLESRTPQWMDDHSVSTSWRGMPTDWCYVAETIRLYPIPDAIYPIYLLGTGRFVALVTTDDTNPWMVEAEELIRTAAEGILYRRIVRDMPMAQMSMADEQAALQALRRETATRGAPARIRPSSYF